MFTRIQSYIAKKQHKCSLCGGVIEKGEQYTRTVVGGGSVGFCDDKYHSKCYELVERYCRNNLDHDDFFDMWAVIDDARACVCDSCKHTKCKRNSATIASCDRVQKQYGVKK